MRKRNKGEVVKHNCGAGVEDFVVKKKKEVKRKVCEMALKDIPEEITYDDQNHSAHQFSQRSFSCQADSEERDEVRLQVELIDLKTE